MRNILRWIILEEKLRNSGFVIILANRVHELGYDYQDIVQKTSLMCY